MPLPYAFAVPGGRAGWVRVLELITGWQTTMSMQRYQSAGALCRSLLMTVAPRLMVGRALFSRASSMP